jgi:hypothetical protein
VARFQILYWQDVPSIVRAFSDDGAELKRELPDWFQQEIDKRAMVQGLAATDAYLEQWRWGDVQERPGSASDVLDDVMRELESEYA